MENGETTDSILEIQNEAVNYFQKLLVCASSWNTLDSKATLENISVVILKEDNVLLSAPFIMDEVKVAAFQLQPKKSLGMYDLLASFFKNCWHFLGVEIWGIMKEFKKNKKLSKRKIILLH